MAYLVLAGLAGTGPMGCDYVHLQSRVSGCVASEPNMKYAVECVDVALYVKDRVER